MKGKPSLSQSGPSGWVHTPKLLDAGRLRVLSMCSQHVLGAPSSWAECACAS